VQFDGIWSNPPIRVGKEVLHSIMDTWLPRLTEGAEGYLVVAKQLGADSFAKWLEDRFGQQGFDIARVDNDKGFRVIRVVRVD
jgi:16S rRNA G1207 methylase RsmC